MLGARSRSSLRTGTTMSTWRTLMTARMSDHVPWRLKPSYGRAMSTACGRAAPGRSGPRSLRRTVAGGCPSAGILLARAPPGGAAADRPVPHLGPAPRAGPAGMPGRDDVAGVHPALGHGGPQGRLERAVQPVRVLAPQAVRP